MSRKKIMMLSGLLLGSVLLMSGNVQPKAGAQSAISDWVVETQGSTTYLRDYVGHDKDVIIPLSDALGKEIKITKKALRSAAESADWQRGTLSEASDGSFTGRFIADNSTDDNPNDSVVDYSKTFMDLSNITLIELPHLEIIAKDGANGREIRGADGGGSGARGQDAQGEAGQNGESIDVSAMFKGCARLEKVDLSSFVGKAGDGGRGGNGIGGNGIDGADGGNGIGGNGGVLGAFSSQEMFAGASCLAEVNLTNFVATSGIGGDGGDGYGGTGGTGAQNSGKTGGRGGDGRGGTGKTGGNASGGRGGDGAGGSGRVPGGRGGDGYGGIGAGNSATDVRAGCGGAGYGGRGGDAYSWYVKAGDGGFGYGGEGRNVGGQGCGAQGGSNVNEGGIGGHGGDGRGGNSSNYPGQGSAGGPGNSGWQGGTETSGNSYSGSLINDWLGNTETDRCKQLSKMYFMNVLNDAMFQEVAVKKLSLVKNVAFDIDELRDNIVAVRANGSIKGENLVSTEKGNVKIEAFRYTTQTGEVPCALDDVSKVPGAYYIKYYINGYDKATKVRLDVMAVLTDKSKYPSQIDFGTSSIKYDTDVVLKGALDRAAKIEVIDNRGVNGKGFKVKVLQINQFKGKQTMNELTNAVLSFRTGKLTNSQNNSIQGGNENVQLLPKQEQTILECPQGMASGETSMPLSDFQLLVPKGSRIFKDTYETRLVWTFSDTF